MKAEIRSNSSDPPRQRRSVVWGVLAYLGFYLLGIVTCLLFTPADLSLAGVPLGLLYLPLATVGYFLFLFYLEPGYVFGSSFVYWLVYGAGVLLVILGIVVHLRALRSYRYLGPVLIAYPLGFVGTLGIYYTAAASI